MVFSHFYRISASKRLSTEELPAVEYQRSCTAQSDSDNWVPVGAIRMKQQAEDANSLGLGKSFVTSTRHLCTSSLKYIRSFNTLTMIKGIVLHSRFANNLEERWAAGTCRKTVDKNAWIWIVISRSRIIESSVGERTVCRKSTQRDKQLLQNGKLPDFNTISLYH